ncbi:MAG: hypothetical protein HY426_03080 [Candidatus Levybacteria bacterium]|nr:hypothetical protein [Candidatus Levybacteria bacterium]
MLPAKTITKKEKKERSRKKRLAIALLLGLSLVCIFLLYVALPKKGPLYISPLSKDQTTSAAKVEKILKEKKISYESLSMAKDRSYVIKLDEKSEVIIDPKKDILEQLSSLQLILSTLKIEGKALRRLDFRYKSPIISL